MERLSQSPTDPTFVQNPYPFYHRARAAGRLVWWEDYHELVDNCENFNNFDSKACQDTVSRIESTTLANVNIYNIYGTYTCINVSSEGKHDHLHRSSVKIEILTVQIFFHRILYFFISVRHIEFLFSSF